jgi:hypothetical protein
MGMLRRCLGAALLALLTQASCTHVQVNMDTPLWAEQAPKAKDYRATYPQQAWSRGINGRVSLLCVILPDRRLLCEIESETPWGMGFGAAALQLAQQFVVRRVEEDPRLVIGSTIRVPIRYVVE